MADSQLINLKTNLKSLTFGKDRPDDGSSNQPYVVRDIPEGTSYGRDGLPTRSGPDFILRDGFLAPVKGLKDLGRLAKMFFDFKSPSGLLFILKQNILSRTGVKTEAATGAGYAGGALNEGVYLPLGTLLDAGLGWAGIHFNKQGIDPIGVLRGPNGVIGNENGLIMGGNLAIKGYQSVINSQDEEGVQGDIDSDTFSTNRLVAILQSVQSGKAKLKWNGVADIQPNITENSVDPVMLNYSGGPGSILGIGKTSIFFSSTRTGAQNATLANSGFFAKEDQSMSELSPEQPPPLPLDFIGPQLPPNISTTDLGILDYSVFKRNTIDYKGAQIFLTQTDGETITGYGGASGKFMDIFGGSLISEGDYDVANDDGVGSIQRFNNSVFAEPYDVGASTDLSALGGPSSLKLQSGLNSQIFDLGETNFRTWRMTDLQQATPNEGLYPSDFRTTIIDNDEKLKEGVDVKSKDLVKDDDNNKGQSTIIALAPNYKTKNRTRRVNQGDPGKHKTGVGPEIKNVFRYGLPAYEIEALDKITALPMYESSYPKTELAVNDFVKFRFKVLKNEPGNEGVYIHFRAYLDSFGDAYQANWGAVNYVGRGEPLYNYQGFGRQISLNFTVVAESKAELVPMLSKLNYLAGSMAPDYGESGFMKGNIVKLTLGAYLYETPGFIQSMNFDMAEDTPWEIAIDDAGGADSTVAELPKLIRVTMQFQPIHKFLAQKDSDFMNPSSKFISMARAEDNGLYKDLQDQKYKYYPADGDDDADAGNNIPGE